MAGSSMAVAGAVLLITSYVMIWTTFRTSSPGAMQVPTWLSLAGAGAILIGGIPFSIGFVVFCGRAGATTRRCRELEMMAAELQARSK